MKNKKPILNQLSVRELSLPLFHDRRGFLKTLTIGGLSAVLGGPYIYKATAQNTRTRQPQYSLILVDFNRCTGCRTCETVCAQNNHKIKVNGEMLPGLGNPHLSNIRVYTYNPDVDVPTVCVMCRDNPCVEACPIPPDEQNRKALYRDPETLAVKCNYDRCIGCRSCAKACEAQRVGAIIPNRETNRPERMCTLCDGDPQCVKYCPNGAITHITGGLDGKHYGMSPDKIAEELMNRWYGERSPKGGGR